MKPPGLSLSPAGVISGTPTQPGIFHFTITVVDDTGCSASQPYSITIQCDTITLAPSSLPNGTFQVPYSQTITGSGGLAPYTFFIGNGTLPPGITLTANGLLSGTPSQSGTFNFTVVAQDAAGCVGGIAYTLVIDCATITLSPSTLPHAIVNVPYSETITASGGNAPYTFHVSSGALPGGFTLSPGGNLGGSSSLPGTFNFTVTASDMDGCQGSQAYTFVIDCNTITISPSTLPDGAAYQSGKERTGSRLLMLLIIFLFPVPQ